MDDKQTTTLPIPPDVSWAIAGLGGVALLVLLIYGALIPAGSPHVAPLERIKDRLGLAGLNSGLFVITLALWAAIFLTLSVGLLWLIWEMVWMAVPEETRATWDFRFALARLAGMTATLGAVVALPFTLIKVRMTGEQTRIAQEGLITDRINKAVEGLGAEKTVKFYGEADQHGKYPQLERTVPNLEVRIGAIYALERIAQDSDRDHVQVMEILCAYIRGNAPKRDNFEAPNDWHPSTDFIVTNRIYEDHNRRKNEEIRKQISAWYEENTTVPRADIQTALMVIGRRSKHQIDLEKGYYDHNSEWQGFRLDLRNTCLQRADLSKASLRNIRVSGAQLQGANLYEADLRRADFSYAELQTANVVRAKLQGAVLGNCQADGVSANYAHLGRDKVSKSSTSLNGSSWKWSAFQNANFSGAFICNANLHAARLESARLVNCTIHHSDFTEAHLERSILVNSFITYADMSETVFSADTYFSGANIDAIKIPDASKIFSCHFKGAAIRGTDLTKIDLPRERLPEVLFTSSVTLPANLTPLAELRNDTDTNSFYRAWRAFQHDIGFDPDNPSTW